MASPLQTADRGESDLDVADPPPPAGPLPYERPGTRLPLAGRPDPAATERAWHLTVAAGVCAVLVGATALVGGWAANVDILRRPLPGSMPVSPIAAAGLILLGTALCCLRPGGGRPSRLAGRAAAAAVILLGATLLAEYVLGVDLGIDRLLYPDRVDVLGGRYPGRPAVDTAVGLTLVGAMTLALATEAVSRRVVLASQGAAAAVVLLSGTSVYSSVYGLLYDQPRLRTAGTVAGMSVPVAVTLGLAAGALLLARPDVGVAMLTSGHSAGARLARWIIATALTVPFGLGFLPLLVAGPDAPYRTSLVVAFLITGNAIVLGTAGLLAARATTDRELACLRAVSAEHDARESNDRLFKVIDNTSAVIYIRDGDGRYLLVNRRYEELFGVRRDQVVGLSDHDMFPTEMAEEFRANDLKALASGAPLQMEETAPHADGMHTYITIKYPITDSAGQPYAICGISTDITDLKRAEEEVRRLNAELELRVQHRTAELEASTRELDAFAYSVSHDLRAPLRALDGFSQVLLEDYGGRLDDAGRDYLNRIRAATQRMGLLIDDLLDLSRATRVELRRREVDLARLAREVLAELRAAEPDRDVEVTVAEPLCCHADAHLLRLVLQNLLANAWKFTARRPHARIEVDAFRHDDGCQVFVVRDNGAGFDPRYADKLFVPFQRLHTVTEFPGSGVGLAIVSRIATRHGGRVWAEGTPGSGAAFFFTVAPPPQCRP